MTYLDVFENKSFIIFAVDQWVFERDVDRGFLGEALVVRLIFPYMPILGETYFRVHEVKLKKRLIREILEKLILDFPELSHDIYIKPEYFLYETLLTRARLFPLLMPDLIEFMKKNKKSSNISHVMPGYFEALKELEKEKIISLSQGFVKISAEFIDEVKRRKFQYVNLFKAAQKALFNSLLGTFPKIFSFLMQNKELLAKFTGSYSADVSYVEDPQAYLYISTANGLVSLANMLDLEDFAKKMFSTDKEVDIKIERVGSVLNDTYLIKLSTNNKEQKVFAKRFKDWSSFKWFPLTLWTVGTRTFAVSGRSRLERECAINQFLHARSFSVPKLLYVNHGERLVLMEYVEGESLEKTIRNIAKARSIGEVEKTLNLLKRVGEKFAEIHALNIALGDAKPENIIVGKNNELYFLDFEQAARNGDKTWDIAEFLYYAGHYFSPFSKAKMAEFMAKAFIEGYLSAGGNLEVVRKAGSTKYTKVFSVFTLPNIMLILYDLCKKASMHG